MEDICNLYKQCLTPDTQVVYNATQQLLIIYENPANMEILIQVVNEVPDGIFKRFALTGLLKMMKSHWYSTLNGNKDGELVMQQLLLIFQNFQSDSQISNMVADCFQPILRTQGWSWIDLINYLHESISESILKVVSYLLEFNINAPEKISQEIIDFCLSIIDKAIKTNSIEIVISSSRVFALLSSFLPQQYAEVLSNFMNFYVSIFSQTPDIELAKSIGKSFNTANPFFDANQLLLHLLDLSTKSNPQIYFIVIRKLVSKFGIILRSSFPFLLQTTISIIATLFTDECYDPSSDSNYIAGITEKCFKRSNSQEFSTLILQMLSAPANSPQELYSTLEIAHSIIDEIDISFKPLYNEIMGLILKSLTVDNHTIIELSLICLIDINNRKSELFEENVEDIFKAILPMISIQHQLIMQLSSKALALMIFNCNISSEILIPLLPSIIQAAGQSIGSCKADLIFLICGFVSRLEDEIQPFASSIIPLIINCSNDTDEEVHCRVIEALGFIIMNAPDQCQSIMEQSMNLFIESLDNESLVESAFLSLANAAKSTAGIDPFIEIAVVRACQIAAPAEDEITQTLLFNMLAAIEFLNIALKFRPDACTRWKLLIVSCCLVNITDGFDDDVLYYATKAIIRALDGYPIAPNILEQIISNAESKNLGAISAFRVANYLIKNKSQKEENNSEANNEFILRVLNIAIAAIKRELPWQMSEKKDQQILVNYDADLFKPLIKFISNFALRRPNFFPSVEFLNLIISLKGKVSKHETEFCLSPFVSLKRAIPQPSEIDLQLFDVAFTIAADNCITGWPFIVLRLILIGNKSMLSQVEQLAMLCLSRIDDQLSALSLLFLLTSKQYVPVQEVISKMIDCIPKKGDTEDLSIIWTSMFTIMQQFPEIEQQFLYKLVIKSAATVNRYKNNFPNEITLLIIQFIKAAIQKNPQLIEQLASYQYLCKLIEIQ